MDLDHLKQLLIRYGITQTELAAMLGRDKSVVTNLFQGKRRLKADEATLIAKHLGLPVADVMGERPGGFSEPSSLIPFQHAPTHSRKSTGIVQSNGQFFLKLDAGAPPSHKTYAVEMPDDSMNLAGILPGDILISELDRPCRRGQTVLAQHYHAKGAKTLVRRYAPPFLLAHSTSPDFPPLDENSPEVRVVSPVLKLIRLF